MPFRSNFFGDTIIQPNTDWDEIAFRCDDFGIHNAKPSVAILNTTFDPNFKIGGELTLFGTNGFDAEDSEEPIEITFQFDNFGSVASARQWLQSLDVPHIDEVA